MSCGYAKYEEDEGRYYCSVTGDGCMYMSPNSKQCAEDFGEGPDAVEEDNVETKDNLKNLEIIFKENGYTEQMINEIKRADGALEISDFIDQLEEERSCWNC